MKEKILVKLNKFVYTRYSYQKLNYCLDCGSYTALSQWGCSKCGKHNFLSIEKKTEMTVKKHYRMHNFILLMVLLMAFMASTDFVQLGISIAVGLTMLAMQIIMQKTFFQKYMQDILDRLIKEDINIIRAGLKLDAQKVMQDLKLDKFQDGYEKLRELGMFADNDSIKEAKIECLQRFSLRKDMELELESIILSKYDDRLVQYIFEISRFKRHLIARKTMDYAVEHEQEILEEKNGQAVIINICEAMLKSQSYLNLYREFIVKYIMYMKKERLIRLCSMLTSYNSAEWQELYGETARVVRERYSGDKDFQTYF